MFENLVMRVVVPTTIMIAVPVVVAGVLIMTFKDEFDSARKLDTSKLD